jgi:Predicted alternative thymidylate synthase
MQFAENSYLHLVNDLKRSPQEARSVLPNSTKTEIIVTANYREWRNFFKLRTAKAAHPQMQEVTKPLLEELKSKLPVIFDDIEVED